MSKSSKAKSKKARPSKTRNPWKTLSGKTVYESPWIEVRRFDVINPAGKPGVYSVVHFRNIAVGVVALDDRGRLLMVGQYRYALKGYSWELPEGGCPIGTSTLATARRELKEETGYSARRWKKLLTMHLSNSSTDERAEIFLAEGLTAGESEPEETEQLVVRWWPLEKVRRAIRAGRITDSITVAAVLALDAGLASARKSVR